MQTDPQAPLVVRLGEGAKENRISPLRGVTSYARVTGEPEQKGQK